MIELSTIRDLVAIFGVIAGFSYYVLTVRANQRNQKHQLFQAFMTAMTTPEVVRDWYTIYNLEWSEYDDFMEKYGWENNPDMWVKISFYWQRYNQFGHQIKIGAFDISQFYDAGTDGFALMWKKYEPIIFEMRRRVPSTPLIFGQWEYLYNEMKKESDRRGDDFFGLKNKDYNRFSRSISKREEPFKH